NPLVDMATPAVDVVIDPPPIVAATRPLQRRVTLGGPGYACTPNPPDVHPKTSLPSCVPNHLVHRNFVHRNLATQLVAERSDTGQIADGSSMGQQGARRVLKVSMSASAQGTSEGLGIPAP